MGRAPAMAVGPAMREASSRTALLIIVVMEPVAIAAEQPVIALRATAAVLACALIRSAMARPVAMGASVSQETVLTVTAVRVLAVEPAKHAIAQKPVRPMDSVVKSPAEPIPTASAMPLRAMPAARQPFRARRAARDLAALRAPARVRLLRAPRLSATPRVHPTSMAMRTKTARRSPHIASGDTATTTVARSPTRPATLCSRLARRRFI